MHQNKTGRVERREARFSEKQAKLPKKVLNFKNSIIAVGALSVVLGGCGVTAYLSRTTPEDYFGPHKKPTGDKNFDKKTTEIEEELLRVLDKLRPLTKSKSFSETKLRLSLATIVENEELHNEGLIEKMVPSIKNIGLSSSVGRLEIQPLTAAETAIKYWDTISDCKFFKKEITRGFFYKETKTVDAQFLTDALKNKDISTLTEALDLNKMGGYLLGLMTFIDHHNKASEFATLQWNKRKDLGLEQAIETAGKFIDKGNEDLKSHEDIEAIIKGRILESDKTLYALPTLAEITAVKYCSGPDAPLRSTIQSIVNDFKLVEKGTIKDSSLLTNDGSLGEKTVTAIQEVYAYYEKEFPYKDKKFLSQEQLIEVLSDLTKFYNIGSRDKNKPSIIEGYLKLIKEKPLNEIFGDQNLSLENSNKNRGTFYIAYVQTLLSVAKQGLYWNEELKTEKIREIEDQYKEFLRARDLSMLKYLDPKSFETLFDNSRGVEYDSFKMQLSKNLIALVLSHNTAGGEIPSVYVDNYFGGDTNPLARAVAIAVIVANQQKAGGVFNPDLSLINNREKNELIIESKDKKVVFTKNSSGDYRGIVTNRKSQL